MRATQTRRYLAIRSAVFFVTAAMSQFDGRLWAETAFPMLMSLKPVAVQVGQSSEVTVNSRYSMYGAYQVLVSGTGVTAEVVLSPVKPEDLAKKPTLEKLTVRFTVAVDAQPGVRDVRIATPQGVSTVAQLVVVCDPVIAEAAKNDTPDKAQQVSLPAAVRRDRDERRRRFLSLPRRRRHVARVSRPFGPA